MSTSSCPVRKARAPCVVNGAPKGQSALHTGIHEEGELSAPHMMTRFEVRGLPQCQQVEADTVMYSMGLRSESTFNSGGPTVDASAKGDIAKHSMR
jgi:hypothetical protein